MIQYTYSVDSNEEILRLLLPSVHDLYDSICVIVYYVRLNYSKRQVQFIKCHPIFS